MAVGDARLPNRFWSKVRVVGECWLWVGSRCSRGYGRFWWAERLWLSHRAAYTALTGPIPTGLQIDHLCRNRACCNPTHLEPVTNRENSLRGVGAGAVNAAKSICVSGHPFSPENTYMRPDRLGRMCRECRRETHRRQEARSGRRG